MTLDETIARGQSGHLADHQTLHEFHNDYLSANPGIRYVRSDGVDSDDGLTWQTAKASVAGAQTAGGTVAKIYIGPGIFDIKTSIELVDGQAIIGTSPHTNFGTQLKAHADLGTDPVIVNTGGNLTSGGLFDFQVRGTADANGGVGLEFQQQLIADNWTIDRVAAIGMTSHGFSWPSGTGAGNPLTIGVVNAFSCGADGVGDGFFLNAPAAGPVSFRYLGGDNNGGSLLRIATFSEAAVVRIDHLKAERTIDGRHEQIVNITNSLQGTLSIGTFRVFHNVSTGSDPNALIKVNGLKLKLHIEGGIVTSEPGTKKYTYGFDSGTVQILTAFFIRAPHFMNTRVGLKAGRSIMVGGLESGLFPNGSLTALVGSIAINTHTSAGPGNAFYVKETGTGNTGWAAVQGLAAETNASRGNASDHAAGYMIFNTDDGFPNWSDGTNWVDATGTTT